jgi:hypothetical protein
VILFPRQFFKDHFHVTVLVLLTLIGGVLRFAWIDRPAIWGDESATLGRVCGSYQDLLDRLQYDGFGPLHYEAYWWIANGFPYDFKVKKEPVRWITMPTRRRAAATAPPTTQPTEKRVLYPARSLTSPVQMTPFVMRFIPALAGTLMIPAMYFLAVQLANRRVALIAATFTTFSAYMLCYSRDAKMYMHLWFACATSVACMLWWFRCAKVHHGGEPGMRTYRRIAWLGWLAASIAMVGLHATGLAVLGLELLFLVTHLSIHPWQWRRAFTGLAVLGIAASGWLVHWVMFSKLMERVERNGYWEVGIFWVDSYNEERKGPDLLKFTASAFATNWEWPPPSQIENIPVRTYKTLSLSCYVLLGVAILGLFPWRKWRLFSPSPGTPGEPRGEGSSAPMHVLPLDAEPSPQPSPTSTWEREQGSQQISIVSLFFLLAWLILPAYAMYCKSIADFLTPWQMMKEIGAIVKQLWAHSTLAKTLLVAIPCAAILWSFLTFRRATHWLIRIGLIVLIFGILFLFCRAMFKVIFEKYMQALANNEGWPSVWMPRYLGYLWPAFAIVGAILIARLPTRPVRGVVIAFLVGINLLNFSWRIIESEPPTDKIAMDVLASQSNESSVRTYAQVRGGQAGAPGGGGVNSVAWRYFMMVYGNVKVNPLELRFFMPTNADNQIFVRQNVSPQFITNDLKKSPQVERIIVWDKVPAGWADPNAGDRVRKALGFSWRKMDERTFVVWDHWTWQEYYTARRREYVRLTSPAPATTQPAVVTSGNPQDTARR